MEDVKEEEKQKAPITETLEIKSAPVAECKLQQPVTAPTPKVFEIQKRDKVAIVGCAESKSMAPFNMPDAWEFWGVNNLHVTMPKQPWTRWFEMHSITYDNITYKRRGLTGVSRKPERAKHPGLHATTVERHPARGPVSA
jgi:hypothetical protein